MPSFILRALLGEWRPGAQALLLPPIRVTLCPGVPGWAPFLDVLWDSMRVLVTDTSIRGGGTTLAAEVGAGGDTGRWALWRILVHPGEVLRALLADADDFRVEH